MAENPNTSVSQPTSRSWNIVRIPSEPDVVSSNSTDSVREQLRQVNQRLDEVQRDFVKSKEEVEETSNIDGVVHCDCTPLGIQRHHRQANTQQTQSGCLNISSNHEVPDQNWDRRSQKRSSGVKAVLPNGDNAAQETQNLAPTIDTRDAYKTSP
ncbi:hypothetical protein BHE74_00023255 [Ensete ventricosum]|nr:hypothetical protein BHE74_00023255 [Ensete ventricosum]